MKTLEEKACDYAEKFRYSSVVKGWHESKTESFIAGYKAAQEWISVEDELPKKRKWILVRINESYHIMCIKGDSDMKFFLANVIVWRPINND